MKLTIALVAAAASYLLYTFLHKNDESSAPAPHQKISKHDKHQLTHAFARAKKHTGSAE